MASKYAKLFEPCKIGNLEIKNRIFMAPMGLVGFADGDGGLTKECQEYYIERARGGTGLLMTGTINVDYNEMVPRGLPCPTNNPIMFINSTKNMVEVVHSHGAKFFMQLTGGLGRSAVPGATTKQIAPSEAKNRFDPRIQHRAMTIEEIKTLIGNFVKAAMVAKKAGFDGVEIHAVHEGYLLDQFCISFFNQRTDEYGGSLENRLRIATEIVQGIKQACGKDFPVSLRYSLKSFIKGYAQGAVPGEEFEEKGRDIEEGIEAAKLLVAAGYDCLNVDAGTYDSWYWNHPPMYFGKKGIYLEFGRILKKEVDVPILLAGRMDDAEMACAALDDCCDMVGYGRPLLADPYLPWKLAANKEEDIRPCLSCHDGCMGRLANLTHVSCAVNPQCGFEKEKPIVPAAQPKKVLVVGGGVGGMEAAMVLRQRGHQVILAEKSDRLGGLLNIAGIPTFKSNDLALIRWFERQLKALDVDIRLNTTVTPEMVESMGVDAIITATGSNPIQLKLEGNGKAISIEEAMKVPEGNHILVIGGGFVGCEVALWLAEQGKQVEIAEMLPAILGGAHSEIPFMNKSMLEDMLKFYHVNIHTGAKVLRVDENSVTLDKNGVQEVIPADVTVMAAGFRSNDSLYRSLMTCGKPIFNIGDSRKFHNIIQAIWDGFEVARSI
jgi:2-enoate reductase